MSEQLTHYPESTSYIEDTDQLELFSVDQAERGQGSFEYEQLSDPDLRYKYVRYTEGLIARAIAEKTDTMIFLDKSARPVAWLMKSLWPTLGFSDFDENGEPIAAKMPDIKFSNIDREQWAPAMGRSETKEGKGITLEGVHPDTIDSLRGLYALKNMDTEQYMDPEAPTMLEGKNILIVDEVSTSGDTLVMAEKLFERAFSDAASIDGMHWMPPEKVRDKRSGGTRNSDLPVWYSASTPYGRLVGNRDDYKSRNSVSMRQRRGAQFLSTRFPDTDTKGQQLRQEMQQLGREVAAGKMPVIYEAAHRPESIEFAESFMAHVNQLSVKEFVELRRQAEQEKIPFPVLVTEYKHSRDT